MPPLFHASWSVFAERSDHLMDPNLAPHYELCPITDPLKQHTEPKWYCQVSTWQECLRLKKIYKFILKLGFCSSWNPPLTFVIDHNHTYHSFMRLNAFQCFLYFLWLISRICKIKFINSFEGIHTFTRISYHFNRLRKV